MAHLTTKQIKQLIEIDSASSGIRAEIQSLIKRLTSGGVGSMSDDPRDRQAKILWDKGFGEGFDSFDAYIASIPEIPEKLKTDDNRFPLLVLVDARLGITKSCELTSLKYNGNDLTFEDFDPKKARTEKVYWMRCQDGRKNRGKSVQTCRENFASDEIGLIAMEGVALYVQNPKVIEGHYLDLVGSVHRESRDGVAGLGGWVGPRLDWLWSDSADPGFGSASRLE